MVTAKLLRPVFTAALAAVGFAGLGAAYATAAPLTAVTFDPGIVVAGQSQFTADKLNLLDYSRVDLGTTTGSSTSFTESGYLQVNNASLNNNTFDPAGNRTAYSLYLYYTATGTQSTPNFMGASTGTINSLTYTLYEAPGATQFSITGDTPTVTGAAGTALATGTLIPGTGATSFGGIDPNGNPIDASAGVQATFAQQLAGFIVSPANATLTLAGAFNNDSNIITVFNNNTSFTLNGGGGDLTFSSTPTPAPEPMSLALLGAGLAGLGFARRRR